MRSPTQSYLNQATQRRIAMLNGGQPVARSSGGANPLAQTAQSTRAAQQPGQVRSATPSAPRQVYRASGETPGISEVRGARPGQHTVVQPAKQVGGGAGVQNTPRTVSRTGERGSVGAGQGAWSITGGELTPQIARELEETRRRTGLGSGFENAAMLAQTNPLTSAMGARPELLGAQATGDRPWLNQTLEQQQQQQQPQGSPSVGRTGRALTSRGGEQQSQQQGQQQQQQESDLPQRRQEAAERFQRETGMTIEEAAGLWGVPEDALYSLLLSGYVADIGTDPETGKMAFRFDYGRIMHDAYFGAGKDFDTLKSELGDNFKLMLGLYYYDIMGKNQGMRLPDAVYLMGQDEGAARQMWEQMSGMSQDDFSRWWQNWIGGGDTGYAKDLRHWGFTKGNAAIGVDDVMGNFLGVEYSEKPNRWLSPDEFSDEVWTWGRDQYRSDVDAYNRGLGRGQAVDEYGNPIPGGYADTGDNALRQEVADLMAWLEENVPEMDQEAIDQLISARQRDADLRNAQGMRAAMMMGGRTGVTPGQSMGQQQQLMQQAGIDAANARAQIRMQQELQNFQARMQHYAQGAAAMGRLVDSAQDEHTRAIAFRAQQALSRQAQQMQLELMERQWQLQNTFGAQSLVDLVGSAAGTITGALMI